MKHSRTSHHRSLRIAAFILAAFLLIFFLARGKIERGLQVLQRPLVAAGTWIYLRTSLFQDIFAYRLELKVAQEQLNDLIIDRIRLEELKKENTNLKEALQFLQRNQFQFVSAAVVSRAGMKEASVFVIDQGTDRGIRIGDPVIVNNGMFIGKVVEVTNVSSTVQALTNPAMATAASILGNTQTIGVAEGISGRLLRLKFIPQETQIKVNDLVVTSGLEDRVPSGLFIGLVNDVRVETNAPFLEAVIEPLADVREFRIVHVLIQNKVL